MKSPPAPSRQEEFLVDYAKRLENNRRDRVALHLRLSGMHPFNRKDHHLRMAAAAFAPFVRRYQGQLFQLDNADMIYVGKGVALSDLRALVNKIRIMFRDDPFVQHTDLAGGFCDIFDLQKNYKPFLKRALWLKQVYASADKSSVPLRGDQAVRYIYTPPQEEKGDTRLPLDAEKLVELERFLERLELADIMRRHFIYAVAENAVPRPVICKHYISIPDLQRLALPDYDLRANPWLFQHCVSRLEQTVIKGLLKLEIGDELPLNIEMHMSSIFLEAFLPFITNMKDRTGRPVVVDVLAMDALADIPAFSLARNFLHANRQKITIAGLDPTLFSAVDTAALRADLYKVNWSGQQKDWLHLHARESQLFTSAVQTVGADVIVLTNCDCPESVASGLAAGISLFQGPYINFLAASRQPVPAITKAA